MVAAAFRQWVDGWNPYDPARLKPRGDGLEPIVIEESEVRRSSARLILVAFIAFFVWSVTAPLDGGVVLTGSVTVAGNRKSVQHLGGGVVQEILVREGSLVKEGDVVLKVNPLSSEANLTSAELQYINLLATESRLLAERAGSEIRWRPEIEKLGRTDVRVAEAKLLQMQLFGSRRSEFDNQQRILKEQGVKYVAAIGEGRPVEALAAQPDDDPTDSDLSPEPYEHEDEPETALLAPRPVRNLDKSQRGRLEDVLRELLDCKRILERARE